MTSGVGLAEDAAHLGYALLTDPDGDVVNKLSGLVSVLSETMTVNYAQIAHLVSSDIASENASFSGVLRATDIQSDGLSSRFQWIEDRIDAIVAIGNEELIFQKIVRFVTNVFLAATSRLVASSPSRTIWQEKPQLLNIQVRSILRLTGRLRPYL